MKKRVKTHKEQGGVDKNVLLVRLHRIAGQVNGIEKMITEEKDCLAVVQQIMAARSALTQVATLILTQASCKADLKTNSTQLTKLVTNLFKVNP